MVGSQEESLVSVLLQKNILTPEQAATVTKKCQENGGNVVEHLIVEGYVDEKQILSIFINQCGFHYINLEKIEVDPQAVAEIPMELIKELKILPIRRTKDMLAVTMVDPLDAKTKKRLGEATVCRILPFVSQQKQIEEFVKGFDSSSPSKSSQSPTQKPATRSVSSIQIEGMPLVERLTFDNFISGKGNEFPYAIAMAVAKAPGKAYNPLFLYSNVGLGKTHLMNAIGNYLKRQNPEMTMLYATCEYFCSRVVEVIKENMIDDFRESFRKLDLLLIDDIEFLGGREKAQEEFFHIFNNLVQNNKQIVVTNDRPPSDLMVLEERLQSRFMGGTVASIAPPDLETRMAILKKKSGDVFLPEDVQRLMAEKFCNNIRELEGALKTLLSFHHFTKDPINIELVQHTLQEMGR